MQKSVMSQNMANPSMLPMPRPKIKITTIFACFLFTHCSLSAVTHAPFHVSVLRPASQVGPMHKTTGMGKLVNAVLLSLINEAV